MRTIYLNCENGVSGDMVLNALADLTEDPAAVRANIERISAHVTNIGSGAHAEEELGIHSHGAGHTHGDAHTHEHGHTQAHRHSSFHRSYREVMEIISSVPVSSRVKMTAEQIYAVIAKAESAVHEQPLSTLHFHEVGRDQAISNVLGVAVCMDVLRAEQVFASDICDGHGTVQCAHGVLEVPVPAVRAMLEQCDLVYHQTEHEGEMVTPSGLAMIIGIGAQSGPKPDGIPVRESEARGARSFTDHGLIAQLYE